MTLLTRIDTFADDLKLQVKAAKDVLRANRAAAKEAAALADRKKKKMGGCSE
jgi:hypothetical protein